MEYLHLFETKSAHDAVYNGVGEYKEPWVAYIRGDGSVSYNKHDYSKDYLTFEALEDTVFNVKFVKDSYVSSYITRAMRESFSYSIDDGETWVTFATPNDTFAGIALTTPLIKRGEKVLWKGIGLRNSVNAASVAYCHFTSTGDFNVCGNIMSLAYGDDFVEIEDLANTTNIFSYFFKDCQHLISAESMVLPATTLDVYCYSNMFNGCKSLTTAPSVLPAATLASRCYNSMFGGCTALTTAPSIPATTLAEYCYESMFSGCTSLATAPELPATTLAQNCYGFMFSGCTSLVTAPELPATTLVNSCYNRMFDGCTSLSTAPDLPATTLSNQCYANMFSGCTSLVTAPELPATTLDWYCYASMFSGCTSLATAPELPVTTLANYCYSSMFSGCTSLTTAPELPATTLVDRCYQYMFNGCTSLTTAPELPATTLANYCYFYMFNGCTSLNYIKAMFTTTPSTTYTGNWASGVASSGTFVKNSAATWDVTGVNGVPTGWTVQTASA